MELGEGGNAISWSLPLLHKSSQGGEGVGLDQFEL
jgi:hypothetical protein